MNASAHQTSRLFPAQERARRLFAPNCPAITDITGAERYLLAILAGLKDAVCDVHLICPHIMKKDEVPSISHENKIKISHSIIETPGMFSRSALRSVLKVSRNFAPNVIRAMDIRSVANAVWASARTGISSLVSFFGWTNPTATTLRGALRMTFAQKVMRRLRNIILDSAYVGEDIRASSPRTQVALIQNGQVPRAIARVDVTAIPSHMKSLSHEMLDAMAMKTRVVSDRLGEHGNLIAHVENGFLFEPGDVRHLVEMLRALSQDSDAATLVGAASQEAILNNYSTVAVMARTLSVNQEVTS